MTDPDYAQDQSSFRDEFEGSDEALHVDTLKIPEVNPEIYKDVEPLLFRGFLHVFAEINGVPFIFKSLNHHEFSFLNLMNPKDSNTSHRALQQFYSMFLAYGVFMVGQDNILTDRDRWLPQLIDMFNEMGDGPKNKVVRYLSEINRRANQATILTEAYSLDSVSRLRWAQVKGGDLTSTAITGLQGTSSLGMNWSQLTWRALNHYADLKEQSEREWENAKFVASAMAGKGMTKVHNQDRRRREQELQDQVERRDKIIRFALLGESPDKASNQLGVVKVARTVEELQTQLHKDLTGEKDWHDMVIEAHENRVKDQSRQRSKQLVELQQNYEERYGTQSIIGGTDLKGLTPEEVQFRVNRRRQLVAQRIASQQVHPELTDPNMANFVDKWSNAKSMSDRDPAEVPLLPTSDPKRVPGVPFGSKKR